MSGIYGETLLAFPEQNQSLTVYEANALVNGGFEKIEDSEKVVIGIFQNTKGKQVHDSNGNLVESNGFEFWTQKKGLNGFFTEIENTLYRFCSSNEWNFEGGFSRYSLEKVVGNGTESEDASWNLGSNSFS